MNDIDEIKRLFIPIIKRSPIIAFLFVLAFTVAKKMSYYITPMYQSQAKIKIDISNSNSISESNLFQDFDVFSTKSTVETEVEVLKSGVLIKKTLKELNDIASGFGISYWRKGDLKKQQLYKSNLPFRVKYNIKTVDGKKHAYDRLFRLTIINTDSFTLAVDVNSKKYTIHAHFNEVISVDEFDLIIYLDNLVRRKVKLEDDYEFKINSEESLLGQIKGSLDVKAVDDDIDVIRVTFKHEVPEKAAEFLNALAKTYIQDYIENKGETAQRTIDFVEKQLKIIGLKLRKAEMALEEYRLKNKIIDTRAETATDLTKISQLKLQLASLEMQRKVLDNIEKDVRDDKELVVSFDAFQGNLFPEFVTRLQNLRSERRKQLRKYRESHEIVRNIDKSIKETKQYIIDAVAAERQSNIIRTRQISGAINSAAEELSDLPTREKTLVVLRRRFTLLEANYNFLAKKRTEATILKEANIALHKVIEEPIVPKGPISPNRTLIAGLVGFLTLIISVVYIFMKKYMKAQIVYKDETEKYSEVPVIGIVPKVNKSLNIRKMKRQTIQHFSNLVSDLLLHKKLKKGTTVTVTSSVIAEGKTFVAENMAKSLARMGWNVLLIDFDLRKEGASMTFEGNYNQDLISLLLGEVDNLDDVTYKTKFKRLSFVPTGSLPINTEMVVDYEKVYEMMDRLKEKYDAVIFNTAPTIMQNDPIFLMQGSDLNLYLARANHTKYRVLDHVDVLIEEYDLKNVYYVVNGVQGRINKKGYYVTDILSWHEILDYSLHSLDWIIRLGRRVLFFRKKKRKA